MRKVSAVSYTLIKDFEEDLKNGIFSVVRIGSRIDVKKNNISVFGNRFLDVRQQHGVVDFVFEKLKRLSALAIFFNRFILKQIR